jgi:hypothetical protein
MIVITKVFRSISVALVYVLRRDNALQRATTTSTDILPDSSLTTICRQWN